MDEREPLTFAPRKTRLAGRLETIRYGDCRFVLVLAAGTKVAGTARERGAEALRTWFGKNVVVTGTAEFKPSGKVLSINVQDFEEATDKDMAVFATLPRPLKGAAPVRAAAEKGGLAVLLGKWPGDESPERLLQQLKELS